NDCTGATIPHPLITEAGGDGIKASYINIRDIHPISGGRYRGDFTVNVESTKSVVGSGVIPVKTSVNITVTPSGANVKLEDCALSHTNTSTAGTLLNVPTTL